MKILAIVVLIAVGFLLDAIMAFLASLGVPILLTYIVPVLVWGGALELLSGRHDERSFLVNALRVIGFGIVFTVIFLLNIPWILTPILLFAVVVAAAVT